MDKGFRIVPFGEFRKMGVSKMEPRPLVVFVNRREAFQPVKALIESTVPGDWGLNEYLRRYKDEPNRVELALRGCKYYRRYIYMIQRSARAMREMREIAAESRKRLVLMVTDKDRPDAEILVNMAKSFLNDGVWK